MRTKYLNLERTTDYNQLQTSLISAQYVFKSHLSTESISSTVDSPHHRTKELSMDNRDCRPAQGQNGLHDQARLLVRRSQLLVQLFRNQLLLVWSNMQDLLHHENYIGGNG